MKRFAFILLLVALSAGLAFAGGEKEKAAARKEKEQYYWIASVSTIPLFLFHDYPTLKEEAESWGAEIHFQGPTNIDVEMQNTILEQVMAKKPAGVLFMPFGEGHNTTINKCIEAGIPLVCIDGDAPNSNRLSYSGTDWVTLGKIQAREMAKLLNGKGDVMLSAVIPNDNTRKARLGIEEEMKKYPGIKILGLQNDKGLVEEAARLAAEQIQANPQIAGFIGIDAASGPGIAKAVEEAGKVGKIKIVCVDNTPDIVEAVQKKAIHAAIVQLREAFEVWGFRVLYAYNHPGTPIMQKYKDLGMAMIPNEILTGVVVMTPANVGGVLEVLNYQEQVYKGMKK
jgi:ribose transport system substrate-binding protein